MGYINSCQCNCLDGGFCSRHGIYKNKHFVKLCHEDPSYFQAWEEGIGPGQFRDKIEIINQTQYPSTITLAKNFGKAMLNYAKSGFKHVTVEQYKDRLNICQGDIGVKKCEHYDNGRCKHVDCGCFLSKKAWLSTENCPLGKWPKIEDIKQDNKEEQ